MYSWETEDSSIAPPFPRQWKTNQIHLNVVCGLLLLRYSHITTAVSLQAAAAPTVPLKTENAMQEVLCETQYPCKRQLHPECRLKLKCFARGAL